MSISIGYNNKYGIKIVMSDLPSVMEAYRQMDQLIKSDRVMIEYGTDGEPSVIRACVILTTKTGRHVYTANPANYTLSITQATTSVCFAHTYEVKIKTGRRVYSKMTNDSMEAATIYVHGLRAGYPVFLNRDGQIVAADNCGPKWASYSIHASSNHSDPTPAPKAGVAPMPETEPDIDIDATLDEMNNAIDDINTVGSIEEHIPEQPVEEAVNLDLVEDAAFLDQDPDGLYHIIRVDDRILDGYMDLRYATKEKAVKHFNALNKAHVAMITFSMLENTDSRNQSYVAVHSFNFYKANKDYVLNAIFHVFSLRESWTCCDIDLSCDLEEILDAFLKSFEPEDGVFFDGEPLEILVDNRNYYVKDEYQRNDAMLCSVYGGSEKEEWRYLYSSKEAIASEDVLYSVRIAYDM